MKKANLLLECLDSHVLYIIVHGIAIYICADVVAVVTFSGVIFLVSRVYRLCRVDPEQIQLRFLANESEFVVGHGPHHPHTSHCSPSSKPSLSLPLPL